MASHNCSNDSATIIGQSAEINAQHFLEKSGLRLREKNFVAYSAQGKKIGEIDLIMEDRHCLVFVEVKMRGDENAVYGHVLETITRSKQNKIIHAAKCYLLRERLYNSARCRFDAVGITPFKNHPQSHEIIWIKNAFEVQY